MNAMLPIGGKFAAAIETAARQFCGVVNRSLSDTTNLRFGTNGSLSVEIGGANKGTWADHENERGGGVLDLLREYGGLEKPAALAWLKAQGFLDDGPASMKQQRSRHVAEYDYVDELGALLYQVVRKEPKDFRQRRPEGSGWVWSIKGVKRVLYRLPEIIAADPSDIVFIAEGEKDVDNLRSIGAIATCNAGGAAKPGQTSKWPQSLNSYLANRDVAILPDNDMAGEQHAEAVASSLSGGKDKPSSIRIVRLPDLPEKGDVSDWLDAGGTLDRLRNLVAKAPVFQSLSAPLEGTLTAGGGPDPDTDNVLRNEDSLAIVFAAIHENDLRYCHHAQHWFTWSGSVWAMNEKHIGFTLAREMCRRSAIDLDPGKEKNTLAKAATAAAVERMAKADRALAVEQSDWNRNPWLLGTPAGTVDLRTGQLRNSTLSDLITKKTVVAPAQAGAEHPVWSRFLHEATNGDDALVAFLQRLVGYCLTGDVTEEMLAFLYGDGGTGKGTFIGTIVSVLGEYAVSVPIETFTANSKLNLEYYRAQMAGARLVTASETEGGATWAESQIKEMTGNETPLSARQPYGKAFTYRPTFKIILIGNHAPRLKARSKAMERRLRIVPFKHAPAKADHSLKERLRAEYPAILRWAIDGCVAWQRDRLTSCDAVDAESGSYFEQQDHFGRWLEERCDLGQGGLWSTPSKLLGDYLAWARDNNEGAISSGEFRPSVSIMTTGRPCPSQTVCSLEFRPPLVRPMHRGASPF